MGACLSRDVRFTTASNCTAGCWDSEVSDDGGDGGDGGGNVGGGA